MKLACLDLMYHVPGGGKIVLEIENVFTVHEDWEKEGHTELKEEYMKVI